MNLFINICDQYKRISFPNLWIIYVMYCKPLSVRLKSIDRKLELIVLQNLIIIFVQNYAHFIPTMTAYYDMVI